MLLVGSPGLNQGGSRRSGSTRAFDMNQLQKSVEVMEKQSSSHSSNRVVQRSSSSAAHNEIEVVTSTNGGGGGHAKPTPLASALAASSENGQEKKAKVRGMWGRISKQGMMAQAAAAAAQQGQPSDQQQTQPRSSLKAGGGGGWDQVLNPMIQKQKQRKRSQAEELNSYYSQQAYSQQQQGIFFGVRNWSSWHAETKFQKLNAKSSWDILNYLFRLWCFHLPLQSNWWAALEYLGRSSCNFNHNFPYFQRPFHHAQIDQTVHHLLFEKVLRDSRGGAELQNFLKFQS